MNTMYSNNSREFSNQSNNSATNPKVMMQINKKVKFRRIKSLQFGKLADVNS